MIIRRNMELQSKAQSIKAIFFDIDGTLFSNRTHKVPPSALEALDKASRNGILIFAATGRHRMQVEDIGDLAGVNFDGYVTLNGQYCYARDNEVYKNPIDPADVKRMAEYAQRTSTSCLFLEADILYVNIVNESVIRQHEAVRSSVPEERDVSRVFEREILQMGLYLSDESMPEILRNLSSCTYTKWKTNGVDIIPIGSSKWTGVEQMLSYFGLSPDQAMSFGDNDNDLEMLAHSRIAVAMGNAGANVKSVADYVTGDVDRDGIYSAMRDIFNWA